MHQFISGSDAAWAALERQATGSCVRFGNERLPSGCTPGTADVGFEIDAQTRSAALHVKRGVTYDGTNPAVRDWLASGTKRFSSFAALRQWITQLAAQPSSAPTLVAGPAVSAPLTDMNAVRTAMRDINHALYLNEDDLARHLQRLVVGQDRALRVLSGVVARHCARKHAARPAVVFAVGPTGVGKTRTAEMLARALNELSEAEAGYQYLRLDMTEYQEAHRVSQLLGAPQGYIGHDGGSQLLDALRSNPRTIVLFDEIEKAHPSILRTLMNAMDAGRLSAAARSSNGHEVDCRKSIFYFTSNFDAAQLLDELASRQAADSSVEDEICRRRLLAAGVAPEIVGRIGRFLVYQNLTPEMRAEILTLSIAEVGREYGVEVKRVEPGAIVELMSELGSGSFGARPATFLIDEVLGEAFAKMAKANPGTPACVSGPPFACVPMAATPPVDSAPTIPVVTTKEI